MGRLVMKRKLLNLTSRGHRVIAVSHMNTRALLLWVVGSQQRYLGFIYSLCTCVFMGMDLLCCTWGAQRIAMLVLGTKFRSLGLMVSSATQ